MKILLAPDSFKGALSAPNAANALARGIRRVWPDADCVLLPVADGGEGTLDTLIAATGGTVQTQRVTGPLGEPVTARWGLLHQGTTAVIEMAQAAGLTLVPADRRDPKVTTTHGVGELLQTALTTGKVKRLLLTLGGSATNDGGAGILSALGLILRDSDNHPLPDGGAALSHLARIEKKQPFSFDASAFAVEIACDVDNPLTGPRGASAVFGPQKGATPSDVALLDAALSHFGNLLGIDTDRPGMGAAGGTTAGLCYLFPHAELKPGIDLVLDAVDFDTHLRGADLVLTGEGRLDSQTLGGKTIAGVARRARRQGVPVGAIVGAIAPDLNATRLARDGNVDAVLPLAPGPCSLEESMAHTEEWLEAAAERAARWMRLGTSG